MKNLHYLSALLLITLLLVGCEKDEETLVEQNILTDLAVEDQESFINDQFVDGINQTYLKETGMTEEELFASLEEDNLKHADEFEARLDQNLKDMTIPNFTEKAFNYDRAELSGAIAYLLYNIKQDPGKYFQANFGVSTAHGLNFELGLGHELIKQAVAKFPALRDHSKRQKIDLYGFSLKGIKISGQKNIVIKIKGKARYRKYKKIFKKYRKIIDRKGSANVEIPLYFNTTTNEITINTIKISKISISGGLLSIINPIRSIIVRLLIKKFVVIKKNINLNISYNFLSRAYLDFKGLYEKNLNNNWYTYYTFKIKHKDFINDIKNKLRRHRIPFKG